MPAFVIWLFSSFFVWFGAGVCRDQPCHWSHIDAAKFEAKWKTLSDEGKKDACVVALEMTDRIRMSPQVCLLRRFCHNYYFSKQGEMRQAKTVRYLASKCPVCHKNAPLKQCTACGAVSYCSRSAPFCSVGGGIRVFSFRFCCVASVSECQKADWSAGHKQQCRLVSKQLSDTERSLCRAVVNVMQTHRPVLKLQFSCLSACFSAWLFTIVSGH